MSFLGIDTSNYTTSVALYEPETDSVVHLRRLLKVKTGEKGLRQSDAVFQHTQALPELLTQLLKDNKCYIDGIGASDRPCSRQNSYMPCFTVGTGCAESISAVSGKPLRFFTHQQGHIVSALWSAKRLDLLDECFIAFHVSGGTTEAVLVTPSTDNIFDCRIVASSLDLKAGQAVDRVGLMLGLDFPCGRELDRLAAAYDGKIKIRPSMKNENCSLSGVENKCKQLIADAKTKEETARYCIEYISASLEGMITELKRLFGELPMVFSGGVMSNSIISARFMSKYGAVFAQPEFSSDNAAGIAILASLR